MLLNLTRRREWRLHRVGGKGTLLFAALLLPTLNCSTASQLPCFVETPVYDASGNRLPFRVVAATPEGESGIDLFTTAEKEYRVAARGGRLYFSERWIGKRPLEITLEDTQGHRIKRRVALTGCQQRTSLRRGEKDSGADVSWSEISGKLSGCQWNGDWWIRGMPMFGGDDFRPSFEGYIRPADGSFWLRASMPGERHILVVGKDRQPLKVFAADVTAGGKNDVGTVVLDGACPK